jgi:hypothetical protein
MALVYLVPKPPDKLEKRHLESGWRHVQLDREGVKELKERVEPLKDKGITGILCSDLDIRAGELVRDHLHTASVRPEFALRRFNPGRHHATLQSHFDATLTAQIEKWKKNKDIPVRSGDSLTSFEKRFVKRWNQILDQDGIFAMLVDMRTLSVIRDLAKGEYSAKSLNPNGSRPAMDRIYKVEKPIATRT